MPGCRDHGGVGEIRVYVDYARCDSTGVCERIAPEVFGIDEDDVLQVLVENLGPRQRLDAEEAARACPKLAISVEEAP